MFVDYFYLDDEDTPCKSSLSANARVEAVTSFASDSGYPFSSRTLASFATEVEGYCKDKNSTAKARLQTRFDQEFPYQENI